MQGRRKSCSVARQHPTTPRRGVVHATHKVSFTWFGGKEPNLDILFQGLKFRV